MAPSPHLAGDNGPEFVARALLKWLADQGIETALIDPGREISRPSVANIDKPWLPWNTEHHGYGELTLGKQ